MDAKPIAVLLTVVLCLQVYGLIRLEGMENEMEITGLAENRCTTIESAEVRVYRGGSLVQTVPLEQKMAPIFQAEWRSQEQPHRLEVVIWYAGQEAVIPVEF
jgi:hypothetical protein